MHRTKILLLAVLAVICAPVLAQKSPPQTVEDQKAVMDAQIDLLKKQAEVQRTRREAAGNGVFSLPSIASISKVGIRYTALLRMPNGTSEYVREGDMLRQGLLVTTITAKQVIVSVMSGKKVVPMPLDFVAVTNQNAMPQNPLGTNVPAELLPPVPNVVLPANPPMVNDARVARPATPASAPTAPTPAQAAPVSTAPAMAVPVASKVK